METSWISIPNHANYSINIQGQVKNNTTGKLISVAVGKIGYYKVNLWSKNKYKTLYIHRILADIFLPKLNGKTFINHIDGNKLNNNLSNLEWCNAKHNSIEAIRIGLVPLGEKRKGSKLSNEDALTIYNLVHSGISRAVLSKMFGISKTQISQIKNKREWKHIHD